jgi:hypothetical protein
MRDVVTIGATRCLDPPNVTRFHENTKGRGRLSDGLRNLPHTWVEWSCSQLLQNTPLHPIAEWGRQRFGGADVPPAQRVVAPPFDGRVGHARLREVISECFRLGRRRSGAAPLRVSEAIAHLGKAIEMADKAGEGAPRAPRPYCQASG